MNKLDTLLSLLIESEVSYTREDYPKSIWIDVGNITVEYCKEEDEFGISLVDENTAYGAGADVIKETPDETLETIKGFMKSEKYAGG